MLNRGIRDSFDWPLFVMVAAIALIGVVNLYSATSAMPAQLRDIYIQQIYWLTLGAGVAVLVASIDYRHYERYGWVAYGIGIVLLALVFLLGREVRGSQRWIPIGSFSLQPSELMKVFFIVALAKHLHNDPRTEGRTLKDLIIPGLILARADGADPGAARPRHRADHRWRSSASIMFLTHLKLRSFVTLVLGFVVSAPLTWRYLLKDYQRERMIVVPRSRDRHPRQGLARVPGQGRDRQRRADRQGLPAGHAEPAPLLARRAQRFPVLGLGRGAGLHRASSCWSCCTRCWCCGASKIASEAKDRFGAVVAVGVSALIFWQTVINLGMVCRLLPVVGITLPLFSYGGSSVLTMMMGIGLLMNISMRRFHF